MIYNNLIIQSKIWAKLNNYLEKKTLPHAFLFYGNDGVGKEAHAIELATLINCLNVKNSKSCGECGSCKKMKILQHGNLKIIHPMPRGKKYISSNSSPFESLSKSDLEDYKENILLKSQNPYYKIKLSKANSILINSIRSLKKDLFLTSIEKGWNIVLILDAEKLCYPNNVSANSLLKILEEPPEKTLFILITSNYSKIINTIKSRCQQIFFPPLATEEIYKIINTSISDVDKLVIANISNGNMNLAKDLEKSINELYDNLKLFINACYDSNCQYDGVIIEKINLLKRSNNHELLLFFRIIAIYFKDLFVFSKSKDIKYVVYKKLDKHYNKITNYYNSTYWILCIDVIENGLINIERNGFIPLSVNGMLIEIRAIIKNNNYIPFSINNWLETG